MTILVVLATASIFAAYCWAVRDAYNDAAVLRSTCRICNPRRTLGSLTITGNTAQFTQAMRGIGEAFRDFAATATDTTSRFSALADLPRVDAPNRSAAVFLTVAERWDNWRHRNGSQTYVPKHRAPR